MRNFLFLFSFLSLFACKKAQKVKENTPKEIQTSAKSFSEGKESIDAILGNSISPEWFSGKGTLSASINGGSMDLDMSIQIRKDSAILLVLRKFGFEGARALITKDSVFLINRMEQNFDKMPLSFLSDKFNLPPQFNSLQQLLLGNPSQLDLQKPYELNTQDSLLYLTSHSAKLDASYQISKKSMKLLNAFFEESGSASKMTMNFENYRVTGLQKEFSYERMIRFFSPDSGNGEVQLNFEEVEFNVPKNIRFQIPSHYQRKSYLKN
jgi:hypothetical protein